ncbi:hypothetical protein AB205_0208150 [Aquarana catesbeiana]|uniref:MADF domain-containing protein n=1 Tax=Aquarana catesbeiana TaxID=8400 RepID=A0A2G9QI87_AQUCT|nr:hypothetical protein AB205_0208150 [Aquarana catesbeiana]
MHKHMLERGEEQKRARDVSHEQLIQLVHARPALWDKRSAEYSDRNCTSMKWEVFEEVTPNWLSLSNRHRRIRGEKIITRWRSLRDRYRRELKEEAKDSQSGAGSSSKKKSPFFEMLDFLRCVMDLRSTTSNISETEEEGDAVDTQPAQEEDVGVNEQGPKENPSSQSTATATLDRQRVPIRSVGATTPRARKRHGHPKRDMDAAMLSFMEEMRATRRADTTDPFSDPNNQDASFARNLYHHLVRVPNERKMDVQMSIFNFTGVCIRAAMSGEPMPPVITHHQRPYHGEQAPQH